MSKFEICVAIIGLIAFAGLMLSMVISPVKGAESTYPPGSPFRNFVLDRFRNNRGARIEARVAGVIGLLIVIRIIVPLVRSLLRR